MMDTGLRRGKYDQAILAGIPQILMYNDESSSFGVGANIFQKSGGLQSPNQSYKLVSQTNLKEI